MHPSRKSFLASFNFHGDANTMQSGVEQYLIYPKLEPYALLNASEDTALWISEFLASDE